MRAAGRKASVVDAALVRQALDLGIVEVVVLVLFQEGQIGVVLDILVLGELAEVLGDRRGGVGHVLVVVAGQRRLVGDLVQFRGDDLVFLFLVFGDGAQ